LFEERFEGSINQASNASSELFAPQSKYQTCIAYLESI